jgi:transcriptional regulator with XRE-family HTH domain
MATTFGDNIRKYRELKGMTQKDLAFALGYKTKGAVNKIEQNVTKLPQNKIKLCADILGIPVAKLFSDAEPVKDPYEPFHEFLPYLAQADSVTLENIRAILRMPAKKICSESMRTGTSS